MIRNTRFNGLSIAILPAAFGLALLAGCGSHDKAPAKLVLVSGKLTMGGNPLPGAGVIFVPIKDTVGTGASGVTDAEGKFTLIHQAQKPGIEPGTYAVTFSKMAMKDGASIPAGKTAADVDAVQMIPFEYLAPNPKSPQTVISPQQEEGHFDFDVPPQ
jgi:hypothetical protein